MDDELKKAIELVNAEIDKRKDEAKMVYEDETDEVWKQIAGGVFLELVQLARRFRGEFYC